MTYTATTNPIPAKMLAASIFLQGHEFHSIADYLNPRGIPGTPGDIMRAALGAWHDEKRVTPFGICKRLKRQMPEIEKYAREALGGFMQPLAETYSVFADWQLSEVEMFASRTTYEMLLSNRPLNEVLQVIKKFRDEHSPRIPGAGRDGNADYEQALADMLAGVAPVYDCYPPLAAMRDRIGGHTPEYVIIAGRAGMGKSWMCDNYAIYNSLLGIPGILINLENSEVAVNKRLHKILSGVDIKPDMSYLSDEKKQHLKDTWEQIKAFPLVKDKCSNEIQHVCAAIRRAYYDKGIRYALIDHLHKIRASYKRDRTAEVGEITSMLQALQMELGIPIIAFAQIGRESERSASKIPTLADLAWNSQIEQDARQVWFLFRPSYYQLEEVDGMLFAENEAMIILAKISEGIPGRAKVGFDGVRGFFDLPTPEFDVTITHISGNESTSAYSPAMSGHSRSEDVPF